MKFRALLVIIFAALSFVGTGQSYQTFNDSVAAGWNITTISMHSFSGENKLLLQYRHPGADITYPAIASFRNNKIVVQKLIMDQQYNNLYPLVQQPNGQLLLPTTIINSSNRFYYNLLTLDKDGHPGNLINVMVNPDQTLAGGINQLGKNKWVDLQTIQKHPDNPGQQQFFNIWFSFFEFGPDNKGRIYKRESTIKSAFNEEVISSCAGNDSSFYILAKRYTKKDFSEYKGVLYCVDMNGVVKWEEGFSMDQYTTTLLIPDRRGVVLAVNTIWGAFLLPNTSMITLYDSKGTAKATTIIEDFNANCSVRNKAGQLVLGGAYYLVDSAARVIVKKPKLVLLNPSDLKTISEDHISLMEGTDGELSMLQRSTSCEVTSMLENKDGTFLLAGNVFKPKNTTDYGEYRMYAIIMSANSKGKIRK